MTVPTLRTQIEAMIGRQLSRERRAGVEHFVPGQHQARPLAQEPTAGVRLEVYELSYVDGGGHAWLVLVEREDAKWVPVYAFRGGQSVVRGMAGVPALSGPSLRALDDALGAS